MKTAWPTVALLAFVWLLAGGSVYGYWATPWPYIPLWVGLLTVATYLNFTVLHDASHGAISRAHPFLNQAMGNAAALYMHGSFKQFAMVHNRHHAFVNQPGKDPDLHCSGPISVTNVLKWGATLFFYFRYYLREKPKGGKWLDFAILGPYLVVWTIYMTALGTGHLKDVLLLWTLPSYLGAIMTVFILDYIPHAPHSDTGRYTHSRTIIGKGYHVVSMMHSYHIAHHLWPSIPWYGYGKAYRARRQEILAAGNHEILL